MASEQAIKCSGKGNRSEVGSARRRDLAASAQGCDARATPVMNLFLLLGLAPLQIAPGASPSLVNLQTPEGAREPQVAVGSRVFDESHEAGRLPRTSHASVFVACGTKNGVYVCASGDSAATFGKATQVAAVGALSLGMRRGPRIAVSGETVVVTAIAGEKGGGRDGDLLRWRSTNYGRTWSAGARINATAGSAREGLHAMAVGAGQELFCAWIDLSGELPTISGSASSDAGVHWSAPSRVTREGDRICPCCSPSAAIDAKGRIWTMWRGDTDGARDLYVASSEDHGATFSPPSKVGTGTWKLDACPMDGGAMTAALGRTTTVWRRDRTVFRAEIAGPEISLGEGEQPWIAAGPAGLYCTWVERRGGALELWTTGRDAPVELDPHANDPVIASSESCYAPVVAVWESGEGDRPKIVAARIVAP